MRKTAIAICVLFLYHNGLKAQIYSDSLCTKTYNFIIIDSPAKLFTMRQFNQNYISAYRIFSKEMDSLFENKKYSFFTKLILGGLLFTALTHEEGHRSILTGLDIGAISVPFINSSGTAVVKGVTDKTLQELRDNDLPNFIRLHTAGLESDYILTQRVETLCSFEQEDVSNLRWEYYTRKLALLQYYLSGLFSYSPDIKEEENELERDIVGHDIYGAIRHLYRPNIEFYRYTDYDDLMEEEKKFVQRAGYRSLINLLNPLIFGINNIALSKSLKINFGLGYTMVPFGDMIDQNIWLHYKDFRLYLNLKEYQNRNNWFWGSGIKLVDYPLSESIKTSVSYNLWNQPKNLDFNVDSGKFGYSIELEFSYRLIHNPQKELQSIYLNIGAIHKTFGFLPEEIIMDKHTGVKFGLGLLL